jgi:hypothetical protein
MGGECGTYEDSAYRVLVGKLEGNRRLAITRRTWQYNIKTYLKEGVWDSMNWIDLAQDRDKWRGFFFISSNRIKTSVSVKR